jgi:hypothetical protein
MLAPVVDGVDPADVGEHAGLLVRDQRAVFPAVPQLDQDVDELLRPRVALGRVRMAVQREVRRRPGVQRRDDVHRDPAAAYLVQRREAAGQVVRLVEGGRGRGHQADPLGDGGDRGQHHGRLEGVPRPRPGFRADGDAVGQEDRVERAPLRHLRAVLVITDVEIGQRVVLQTPAMVVLARVQDVRIQVELACGGTAGAHMRLLL